MDNVLIGCIIIFCKIQFPLISILFNTLKIFNIKNYKYVNIRYLLNKKHLILVFYQ